MRLIIFQIIQGLNKINLKIIIETDDYLYKKNY